MTFNTPEFWITTAIAVVTPIAGAVGIAWKFGSAVVGNTSRIERVEGDVTAIQKARKDDLAELKSDINGRIVAENAETRADIRELRQLIIRSR